MDMYDVETRHVGIDPTNQVRSDMDPVAPATSEEDGRHIAIRLHLAHHNWQMASAVAVRCRNQDIDIGIQQRATHSNDSFARSTIARSDHRDDMQGAHGIIVRVVIS